MFFLFSILPELPIVGYNSLDFIRTWPKSVMASGRVYAYKTEQCRSLSLGWAFPIFASWVHIQGNSETTVYMWRAFCQATVTLHKCSIFSCLCGHNCHFPVTSWHLDIKKPNIFLFCNIKYLNPPVILSYILHVSDYVYHLWI